MNDLDAMNEREAEKFVKKDNIWKKPDYEAMLEDGIPLGVVYFIKKARDGLNASPQYYRKDDTPEKRLARQKEYIQTVRELQSVVSEVRTAEDAMQVYDRFFDQKVPKGYAIHFNDGKNTYSKNNDWKPDTYYVTKGYSILQTNFETREAALKWVQELAKGRSIKTLLRHARIQIEQAAKAHEHAPRQQALSEAR